MQHIEVTKSSIYKMVHDKGPQGEENGSLK
jgi:hypothetical protein